MDAPTEAPRSSRWRTLLRLEPGEEKALAWSFGYFFLLLAAYYVLRPVRTEMAVQSGVKNLPWLFTATFLLSLALQPAFAWLGARLPRARLLPGVYAFFALNLLVFHGLFGFDAQAPGLAMTFVVWLSVFNLFVVSVFWSFMADVFSSRQGQRLFGVISAGGSLGAIAGAGVPAFLVQHIGIANLMLVSATLLTGCIACIHGLRHSTRPAAPDLGTDDPERALGGGALDGIRAALSTPYLGGISLYILLWTYSGIVLDLEIARLFAESIASPIERTQLAARMEQAVSVLALVAQLFLTNRLIERFGVAAALVALPAINLVGFVCLAVAPSLAVIVAFDVVRRAGEYAISKPGREVLFTVVDREAKYKAKNFIDTALTRGGTVFSGWTVNGLKALGATGTFLAMTVVPVALAWALVGVWLARRQAVLARRKHP